MSQVVEHALNSLSGIISYGKLVVRKNATLKKVAKWLLKGMGKIIPHSFRESQE
jgi:hypothetical protein